MRQLKKCNLIQKTIASLAILLTLSTAIVIKPVYAVDGMSVSLTAIVVVLVSNFKSV